jgi:hypothetical protein
MVFAPVKMEFTECREIAIMVDMVVGVRGRYARTNLGRPTLEKIVETHHSLWCLSQSQFGMFLHSWYTTRSLSRRRRPPNRRNSPPARVDAFRYAIPSHAENAADRPAHLRCSMDQSDECDHDRSGRDRDRGRFQRGNGWPPLRRPWSPRRPCRTPTGAGQKIWQC